MFFGANTHKRNLKRFLLVTIVVTVGGVVVMFGIFRWLGKAPQVGELIKTETEMSLHKVRQTAVTNGIKEWTLDAESVDLMGTQKRMLLTKPSVDFYMQDGSTLHMTADKGVLATDAKDISVSGQVSVQHKGYHLQTDRLEYQHASRRLFTDSKVTINGSQLDLIADSLAVDIKAQTIVFEGNVKGTIREALTF